MDINSIINSIFSPRNYSSKDDKDILINVENNINVAIRLFIKSRTSPTIIFFHGNAETALDYNDIANYYNEFNINLIVCEYRGYGLSNGTPIKENLHSDSLIIFDYIYKYLNKNNFKGKLIIMGRSLGSCSAAHIIFNKKDKIDGCIIESGFCTEHSLLNLMQINIDFKLSDGFDNLKKFKSYDKPLLIIHADLDDIIPISQAELLLLKSKSTKKDLFIVNGANHNNILLYSHDNYFNRINAFIQSI